MTLKSKSKWIFPDTTKDDYIDFLLKSRGIEDIYQFLHPSLDTIESFIKLYDSKSAAKEIVDAIKRGEKIIIHGDFDADGISSVSILWEFLFKEVSEFLKSSVDVIPYIPNRVDQGYGLTVSSLDDIVSMKTHLVITVDCGVRDKDLIKRYSDEKGIRFNFMSRLQ